MKGKLLGLYLILILISCHHDTLTEELLNGCMALADLEILVEDDLDCFYNTVFLYRDNIYFVCECCVCDKAPIAVNCNWDLLCDFEDNCMVDFYRKAEFLFYTTLEM